MCLYVHKLEKRKSILNSQQRGLEKARSNVHVGYYGLFQTEFLGALK